ncbi:MAG: carboxypeptidase regulatory-like domain-containing protein [Candidatus Acidiferrales bacterium]|jgi:virginiamycin B lyase
MYSKQNRTLLRLLMAGFAVAWLLSYFASSSFAQEIKRGTITGTVTADQGKVVGFRVQAHNVDLQLWYTVFTNKGHYVVPQALPGNYDVFVDMGTYDSPRTTLQLGPGDTKTADFAIKKRAAAAGGGGEEGGAAGDSSKVSYVSSMEDMYPPSPALDLLKANCIGCHAETFSNFGHYHLDKAGYLKGIEHMTETGPGYNPYVLALGRTPINKEQKDLMADYLAKNFGPGMPEKRLRVDPVDLDEEMASKAIYVSYDIPKDLPIAGGGEKIGAPMINGAIETLPYPKEGRTHHMGSSFISPVDGNIWFSSRTSSSMLRLDPKQRSADRWKNYPIKGDVYVHPDGIGVDKRGHVFWAELKTGRLGELDPATGKQIRYSLPEQAGALHEAVVDKDGNVGFDLIYGALFGRLNPITGVIHMYPTPTPDNGLYGMVIDQQGNMWAAGWQKGTINKWDVNTESVKEYPVPHAWGQIRRIGVDSKGVIWASEYTTGLLASLDPATGELTEYRIPYNGAQPYDAWPDKNDNVWMGDAAHNMIVKYDPKTRKFSFVPMPQPGQSINKFRVADDNTLWFGSRAVKIVTGVHFYPNGYTADAPPMP